MKLKQVSETMKKSQIKSSYCVKVKPNFVERVLWKWYFYTHYRSWLYSGQKHFL